MSLKISKLEFNKNSFIGLYFKANDNIMLAPKHVPEKILEAAKETLAVEAVKTTIDNSHYVGIYTCMNNNGILVPESTSQDEIKFLKKYLNVGTIPYPFSAVSNNIACNNKYALVSELLPEKIKKEIADALGVEVITLKLEIPTIGTLGVCNDNGILCSTLITEEERKGLEELLKTKVVRGSVNFGVPFPNMGLVANNKGAIVGHASTGIEVQKIYEGLS